MLGVGRRFASLRRLVAAGMVLVAGVGAPGLARPAHAASGGRSAAPPTAPFRDWAKAPAIVEMDHGGHLYALSDPHGGYRSLSKLLETNGLIVRSGARPTDVRWAAGASVLVVNGDIIDKGEGSIDVVDMLRHLQRTAPSSGGRVVVTLGNHEAEFLADPENRKATAARGAHGGFATELIARGEDPAAVAAGKDAAGRGKWLRELPFGARVQNWFFAHSGNTKGLTIAELGAKLEKSVDAHGFAGKQVLGRNSILEARRFYGTPMREEVIRTNAARLGVDHVGMGHDPRAMGSAVGKIAASPGRTLVKLDTGMGYGRAGHLLHVDLANPRSAESLSVRGHAAHVF